MLVNLAITFFIAIPSVELPLILEFPLIELLRLRSLFGVLGLNVFGASNGFPELNYKYAFTRTVLLKFGLFEKRKI